MLMKRRVNGTILKVYEFLRAFKMNRREHGHRAKRRRAGTDSGSRPISASSELYSIGQITAMILHLNLLSYETSGAVMMMWRFYDD